MKKFKNLTLSLINLPIYSLSSLIPRDKKTWVFGAWFGRKYADNSKYFFEYVCNNHPEIRCVWLSTDEDTLKLVRAKGYEAYFTYSLKGYWVSARSFLSFVSTGFDDVNKFIPSAVVVNLWHGNPLKKIVYDDKITRPIKQGFLNQFLNFVFPFRRTPDKFDFIVASSKVEASNLSTAFKVSHEKVLVTGLPRNDVFKGCINRGEIKKAIYMPTHRNEGELNVSDLFLKDIFKIDEFLKKLDVHLDIKLHFYNQHASLPVGLKSIRILSDELIEQDIYTVLPSYDLLITDYSSVFFDFSLTQRPIIFSAFDLESYTKLDRELYYDYEKILPGPICKNWDQVLNQLLSFKQNPYNFESLMKEFVIKFHEYDNGCNFSERLFQKIKCVVLKESD